MEETSLKEPATGAVQSFLALALPVFLISFSNCALGFFERIWLSELSPLATQASINAVYILKILQSPCISMAMMNQVFVGYYHGSNEPRMMGRCSWQMIWFSLLSILITLPLSFCAHHVFLKNTEIEHHVTSYFFILASANFLFPLGTTLLSFYLGRGKFKLLSLLVIFTYTLNFFLDRLLIFGWDPWIPPMGLQGTAIATVASQGLFCTLLFALFLHKKNHQLYGTRDATFDPKSFKEYIFPAIPRSLGRLTNFLGWAASARIMTVKGGEYLLHLSIGGTISLFLSFIGEGFLQSLTVLVSNAKGSQDPHRLKKLFRSTTTLIVLLGGFLAFPLVLFPQATCSLFHVLDPQLHHTLFWIWIHTIVFTTNSALTSIFLAFKDTVFLMLVNLCLWITGNLPIFFAINYLQSPPHHFWMLITCSMLGTTLFYLLRLHRKKWLQPQAIA